MFRKLFFLLFISAFTKISYGQKTELIIDSVIFSDLTDANIDSLATDSLVKNEFKMINYCYCYDLYKVENEKDMMIKPKNTDTTIKLEDLNYGYIAARIYSFHYKEHFKSFFAHSEVEFHELDFSRLANRYYTPMINYYRNMGDGGFGLVSAVFDCFYAVEKMPLEKELRLFLNTNRNKLKLMRYTWKKVRFDKNDIFIDD